VIDLTAYRYRPPRPYAHPPMSGIASSGSAFPSGRYRVAGSGPERIHSDPRVSLRKPDSPDIVE
jgi:hypothetical protein